MLARMALSKVVAVVVAGVSPFELGVACEGFGVDRTDDGVPGVEFAVASVDGAAVPAFKASGDITSMSRADGYIEIPADVEFVERGSLVDVMLF